MNLQQYLDPNDIFDSGDFQTTDQFYAAFAKFLFERQRIDDPDKVKRLFIRRENVQSTAIGKGAATPHIYSDQFKSFFIAAARIRNGLDYKAPDENPVFLVFLIMSDERDVGLHLKTLAHLARMINNTDIVEEIRAATDAADMHRLLLEKDRSLRA